MLDLLQQPAYFAALAGLLGLCVGSFLNVAIHRLPKMMERQWRAECAALSGAPFTDAERYDLVLPRSACPHCGHRITVIENIPLLGWLLLRGRCSACDSPIGWRYPAVELLGGLLSGYVGWRFGFSLAGAGALVFTWAMIVLAFIDIDTCLLPDSITLPLLWLGLLLNLAGTYVTLDAAVGGAAAGYLALWSVYWAFRWATGKEGMGHGDFKLLAAIGAWLGWMQLPLVILLSAMAGAATGIAMIVLTGRDRARPIPFGPFLAVAGLTAMLHGQTITRAYLGPL